MSRSVINFAGGARLEVERSPEGVLEDITRAVAEGSATLSLLVPGSTEPRIVYHQQIAYIEPAQSKELRVS